MSYTLSTEMAALIECHRQVTQVLHVYILSYYWKLHQVFLWCLQYKCCGANLFEDWQYSHWQKENLSEGLKVPDSCCKTVTPRCGKSDHPSNIHYTVSSFSSLHLLLIFLLFLTLIFYLYLVFCRAVPSCPLYSSCPPHFRSHIQCTTITTKHRLYLIRLSFFSTYCYLFFTLLSFPLLILLLVPL
jgi:hypothetical protein